MPTPKTRIHRKPATKARPAAKAKRARKATVRASATTKRAVSRKRVSKPKTVKIAKRRIVLPVHLDETTITLGPHTTNHHMNESAFRVHPGPTMHPVGPMAMKHPRATLRHH